MVTRAGGATRGLVGRTPWSAAGPLAGFLFRYTKADEGVGRGPGVRPTLLAFLALRGRFNRDTMKLEAAHGV